MPIEQDRPRGDPVKTEYGKGQGTALVEPDEEAFELRSTTLNSSRWSQNKESFKKAMEPKGVKVLRWYLCMPREMQKEDIEKWKEYKEKKENEFPDIELRCIDGNEIIFRLEECDRLKNTALIDKYFHENHIKHFTNKDLIIPFTMSKANGAQGGTYVPREDLLIKIEKSFKTERIVFCLAWADVESLSLRGLTATSTVMIMRKSSGSHAMMV